jgi:hypothetical protein
MLTQTVESQAFDVRSLPTPSVFTHIVTLIHRSTGDEVTLTIETLSDRFCDVIREISHQKAIRKLFGYEIYEVLDCNNPF